MISAPLRESHLVRRTYCTLENPSSSSSFGISNSFVMDVNPDILSPLRKIPNCLIINSQTKIQAQLKLHLREQEQPTREFIFKKTRINPPGVVEPNHRTDSAEGINTHESFLKPNYSITELEIFSCTLTKSDSDFIAKYFPNINKLIISFPVLPQTDSALEPLFQLKKLNYLGLYGPGISDISVNFIVNCKTLDHLEIHNCINITNKGFQKLYSLSGLKYLEINYCELTSEGLIGLEKLQELHTLILNENSVILGDPEFERIGKLKKLTRLELVNEDHQKDHNYTDTGLVYLSSLPKLEHLELNPLSKELSEEGLQPFSALVNLTTLTLDHCNTKMKLDFILKLINLVDLTFMYWDKLDDTELLKLKKLKKLVNLSLNYCNQLTEHGLVQALGDLKLNQLHLAKNAPECDITIQSSEQNAFRIQKNYLLQELFKLGKRFPSLC